jgi:hypothetical protein
MKKKAKTTNQQNKLSALPGLLWLFLVTIFDLFGLQYSLYVVTFFANLWIKVGTISFTNIQWGIIFCAPIPLTALSFWSTQRGKRKAEKQLIDHKVIFELTSVAIDQCRDLLFSLDGSSLNYKKEILQYIQKIMILIIKEHNLPDGDISTNYMLKMGNSLRLVEFDLKTKNRKKIDVAIYDDLNKPLPGAPKAIVTGEIVYMENKHKAKYLGFFKDKPYGSFFSCPICDQNGEYFAVINIDSTKINQFKSLGFIKEKIIPTITPMISLLQMEYNIDKKGNNKVSRGEGF